MKLEWLCRLNVCARRPGRRVRAFTANERGIALVASLLVTMLVSALLVGYTSLVVSDQKIRTADADGTQAFYAAHAGLEKLTADLGTLFEGNYAATGAQIQALATSNPSLPGVHFTAPDGGSGYTITFPHNAQGNPIAENRTIASGPFQGFLGLLTQFDMTVTAIGSRNSEAQLGRSLQLVSIPLFQFGVFSETDLGFHAGPEFDFGGRVHTNGNLYLASGSTLTLPDRVTARGEVIRTHLMNNYPSNTSWTGNVRVRRSTNSFRNLGYSEGSLTASVGSSQNEPLWTNLSLGTYNGNIRNGRTGAKRLDLPLVSDGATPLDLIRRPSADEATTSSIFQQRYFATASLRILLSDTEAAITDLPTVTGTAPIPLGVAEPYAVDATHPPFAEAGAAGGDYLVDAGSPMLGGFIKIEKQVAGGNWVDVTLEILQLGISDRNLTGSPCAQPNPDAVIRLQRLRNMAPNSACGTGSLNGTDYWPKTLYDTREAKRREDEPTGNLPVYLAGVMHYVELDVDNLRRWFEGDIGASGGDALNVTGYTVYFSDRRGNRNLAGEETGDFGFEDFVNPGTADGAPNGALDAGEDLNANGQLDVYGGTPVAAGLNWTGALAAPTLWSTVTPNVAQSNPARFFRRALKLVNGRQGNIITPGLSVASENPVYVQGDYNANAGFGNPHAACSIVADAVTLLSNNWSDRSSFTNPHNAGARNASETWFRMAVITGKGRAFPRPNVGGPPLNFGSDGGAHNFLRYLEDWDNITAHYRGSLASLYYNRQGVGVFKDGSNTYNPPNRDFRFDVDFLQPTLLPPRTPMFRDVNTLGFSRILR